MMVNILIITMMIIMMMIVITIISGNQGAAQRWMRKQYKPGK